MTIAMRKESLVESLVKGIGKAEIVSVHLKKKSREMMTKTATYLSPRTNSTSREHAMLIGDAIQRLSTQLKAKQKGLVRWTPTVRDKLGNI